MPPGNQTAHLAHLLRTLIYGPSKARKTTWVLKAAAAGYNVILFDGDDGAHVLKTQTTEAMRERIHILDVVDLLDRAVFSPFLAKLFREFTIVWDETAKDTRMTRMVQPDHAHYRIDLRKLTSNDILVIDSWTALATSTGWEFADKKEIDVTEITKNQDMMWPGFEYQGRILDFFLKVIHAIPCHVVVIAHSTVYEKWDRRDKRNPKLEWVKTIPVSSSGPQGMKLAKNFSDVLYFDRLSDVRPIINTGGSQDRDGGSRFLPPKTYNWSDRVDADQKDQELSLAGLLQWAGFRPNPEQKCEGMVWFPPGVNPYGEGKVPSVSIAPKPNGNGAAVPVQDGAEQPPAVINPKALTLGERIKMRQQS